MESHRPLSSVPERLADLLLRRWNREYDPDSLRSIPSWGLSLLLHALCLLLLALLIRAGNGPAKGPSQIDGRLLPGEIGDVTSLVEAPRSGDPFTREQSDNPPSLGLEPVDPLMKLASQPNMSSLVHFAPEVSGPAPIPNLSASTRGMALLPGLSTTITAPFSGRQGLGRSQLVRREGGTVHSEKAVEDGLAWIVRHQKPDGSWSLNFQQQCGANGCPEHQVVDSDTAATGLALMPLLGAGYIHTVKSKHQDAVRRGLDWLIAHQQPNGDMFVGGIGIGYLYSHAIATMTLCEAYGLSRDSRLLEPAQRAVAFIVDSQHAESGGWRYNPGQLGDTSVFGWQIFALRSAHLAGLKIPRQTLRGCTDYLNLAAVDPKKVTYAYQPGHPVSPVMTAEALVSRQLLGWPRSHPSLIKGAGRVAAHLESSNERNIYYWYYATQLLHNLKNKDWEKWNPHVREALIKMQVTEDTCALGSWDPAQPVPDRWGQVAGRLFETSLSILTLEVYYRYLPLYRTSDTGGLEGEEAVDSLNNDDSDAKAKPKARINNRTAALKSGKEK